MIMINWINLLKATGIVCVMFATPLILKILIEFLGVKVFLLSFTPILFVVAVYVLYKAINLLL